MSMDTFLNTPLITEAGACSDDNTYRLTFTAGLVGFNGFVELSTLPAVSCVRAVWAVTKSDSLNNVSISTAIFRK